MFCKYGIKKTRQFLQENTHVRVSFFNKVNRVIAYFHFWFYKLFLQKQPFQSNCSKKFRKSNRKTPAMKFFFCDVGDCNFIIKGFHQRFFPVTLDFFIFFIEYLRANDFIPFRLLWDFTNILKAIKVAALSKQ